MKFATTAIHAGQAADPATGATIVPIYQTSTFTQQAVGVHKGYEYSRSGNPTRAALEECLAKLENGRFGLAFASGLAANMAVLSTLAKGDKIAAVADLYGGTFRIFEKILRPLGIETAYIQGDSDAEIKAALSGAKMLWSESPTNPTMRIVDIARLAKLSKRAGAIFVVDNTFATPVAQKPLDLGADAVVHSTTKYIAGHSDTIGGAAVFNDAEFFEKVKFYQNAAGGAAGAFDSWLVLRGLKTLQIRMERHEKNALKIAEFLQNHPRVEKVNYPGLKNSPQYKLAKKQMSNFGGMISFELRGGAKAAKAAIAKMKIFSLAESLGGVESLVSLPAEMTHASIPRAERLKRGIADGLIRLSVGIEDIDDLLEDLRNALK